MTDNRKDDWVDEIERAIKARQASKSIRRRATARFRVRRTWPSVELGR